MTSQTTHCTGETNIKQQQQATIPIPIEADTPQIGERNQNHQLQQEPKTNENQQHGETSVTKTTQQTIIPPTVTPVLQKEDTNTDIQMSPVAVSNLQYIIPRPVLEEGQISNTDSQMSPAIIPIPKQRYPTKNTQPDQEINDPARFCI